MTELVADILASAAVILNEEQPTLSKFTSETNEYEPNLSFHYANNLGPFLFWLDCDFDVIKPNLAKKRPDIIFHRRGIQALNFLVVEVKRHESDATEDIDKIRDYWFPKPLCYRFGASVVLGKNGSFSVALLENRSDKGAARRDTKRFNELRIPKASERQVALARLSDLIFAIKRQDPHADVSALEREMDELINALYG
jgi:hypothetical protein